MNVFGSFTSMLLFPSSTYLFIDIQVLRFSVFGLWSLVLGPLALFGPTLPSQCLLQQQQQRCLSRVGMGHVGGPCLDNDIF